MHKLPRQTHDFPTHQRLDCDEFRNQQIGYRCAQVEACDYLHGKQGRTICEPAPKHHAEQYRSDGRAFEQTVRLDQFFFADELRQDAVFGRRIRRRAQTHNGIPGKGMQAAQNQRGAGELDQIGAKHHAPFGPCIRKRADVRRKQNKGEHKRDLHQRQQTVVARSGFEHCNRRNKQHVICHRG